MNAKIELTDKQEKIAAIAYLKTFSRELKQMSPRDKKEAKKDIEAVLRTLSLIKEF